MPVLPDEDHQLEPIFSGDDGLLLIRVRVMNARSGATWTIGTFPISRGWLDTLPFFDQYSRGGTIWSPNSRHLVLAAVSQPGVPGLFIASATGITKPRFVTTGDAPFWSP